jgi:hypothetical protein
LKEGDSVKFSFNAEDKDGDDIKLVWTSKTGAMLRILGE